MANEDGKIPFLISTEYEGVKQVNLRVYDMSNNYDDATASITLDKEDPVLSSCTLVDPEGPDDGFANTRSLTFQLSGTDDQALGSMGYVIDNAEGTMSWQDFSTDEKDITLPDSDGTHTVYFRLRDDAGNLSDVGSDSIVLDRTAPTGTVQVKGGSAWICDGDQNAVISITRSDLSTTLSEIDMAIQVDGDGWTIGDLVTTRTYSASVTDVDLFPDSHTPSSQEEVTVSVRLIDTFGHDRTVTDTFRLDFGDPTVSSFVLRSLDSYSSNRTDYCRPSYPDGPEIRFEISKADTGGSGLDAYRYDTNESGVNWSSWITDTGTSSSKSYELEDEYGTKTVYLQVRDKAGNISTTYSDSIQNHYHAYFNLYYIYVSDDADSGAGEIYWDFSFGYRTSSGGSVTNIDYLFNRADGQGVSVTSPAGFYLSGVTPLSGEYRTRDWYSSTQPYSFSVYGYLVDDDGSTGDDWSDPGSGEAVTGASFNGYHNVSVSDGPSGYIRYYGYNNID